MPTRLTGIPALSYMGVEAAQPPNITFHPRAPLASDYQNFNTGDLWVDTSNFPPNPPTAANIWMLVSKQGRVGTWVNFSTAAGDLDSLTGDTGGPVFGDANQNINILSGISGLSFDGNPPSNTITLNLSGGGNLLLGLAAEDSPPNVFPDGNGIITLEGTAGNIITEEDAANNAIVFNTGGGIATQYTTDDANFARPAMGNLNVLGGAGITTSTPVPGGDTINITATFPVNPASLACFSVSQVGTVSNATGDGTFAQVEYDNIFFDIGGNFNTVTHEFTAPVNGIYFFHATTTLGNLGVNNSDPGSLDTMLITPAGNYEQNNIWTGGENGGQTQVNSQHVIELSAGDTVSYRIAFAFASGGSLVVDIIGNTVGDPRSMMSGYLVLQT